MTTKENDKIFIGPILPTTIKIGLPIYIGNLIFFLFLFCDTYFIAAIDPESTALVPGTGLIFPFILLCMSLSMSLETGVSSLVGRSIGEKRVDLAGKIATSGIYLALLMTVSIVGLGYLFRYELLSMLSGNKISQEAIDSGIIYFVFILPALAFEIINKVLLGIPHGAGDTKIMATSSLISVLLNIILDPLFIFTFKMGVAGAGLATSTAYFVGFLYILYYLKFGKNQIKFDLRISSFKLNLVNEIMKVALPLTVRLAIYSLLIMIFNKLISNIGEVFLNAWTIVSRLDYFLLAFPNAIAGATLTMMAQNFGRQNQERIKKIFMQNTLFCCGFGLILFTAYILIVPLLLPFFTDVPEVLEAAVMQVRYITFTFLGAYVLIVGSSTFQATDRNMPIAIISVIRLVLQVGLALYLLKYYSYSIQSIFIAIGVGYLTFIPIYLIWISRHLRKMKFRTIATDFQVKEKSASFA